MSITTNGVYVGGIVKIEKSLDLAEGTQVRVVVTPLYEGGADPLAAVIGSCPTNDSSSLAAGHDELLYGPGTSGRSS
jgi:predicted DNA-binding antitoxin AbrB/MazE fold protein